jgi:predicted solute-binding protein
MILFLSITDSFFACTFCITSRDKPFVELFKTRYHRGKACAYSKIAILFLSEIVSTMLYLYEETQNHIMSSKPTTETSSLILSYLVRGWQTSHCSKARTTKECIWLMMQTSCDRPFAF